jgi:proton-dependent oligopeptide transporter, POT family
MWEIFALFGMRAVLVYYLVSDQRFSEPDAVRIYGLSTAAAYFTALLGGAAADRLLGVRRAALIGALLMALGHFLLASGPFLFAALGVIAIGNGFFRPTMLAHVGMLYGSDDPRRERGYNIYAVGCNLGATIAPLVCGALGAAFGWKWAFVASGVGMLISAATLIAGRSTLAAQEWQAPAASLSAIDEHDRSTRGVLFVLAMAWLAGAFFWTAYGQIGGAVALWAQHDVDRTLHFGSAEFVIPAAWFQSLNPLLIFMLAPIVNWLWARDRTPVGVNRDTRNMAMGGAMLAGSFVVFATVAAFTASGAGANPLWVVLAIVPFTLGEFYLDTIGQSMFSRLAPRRLLSVFMGVWMLALMLGHVATGWLGRAWEALQPGAFFGVVAGIALMSTVLLVAGRSVLLRRVQPQSEVRA